MSQYDLVWYVIIPLIIQIAGMVSYTLVCKLYKKLVSFSYHHGMRLTIPFLRKNAEVSRNIFSTIFGQSAPSMHESEYRRAYASWVFACVDVRATDVSTIDLHLMRRTSRGTEEIKDHIALNLLNTVNPYMSSSDLWIETQSFLDISGNTFWFLPKGQLTKKPVEIYTLDPSRVTVVRSRDEFIAGYIYLNDKLEKVPLDKSEVIHFRRFNPNNKRRGMGIIEASALAIETDKYSAQWNRNFFYNSATPSLTLETDKALTTEQYTRIMEQWNSRFGGLDNAHKMAILEGGLKSKQLALSQKDMDFLEQRKFTRDEIMAMFKVPKTRLGMTEGVTVSNAYATDYVFAKTVTKPNMQFIVDRLNEFYLPLFGEDPRDIFFTYTSPVPEDVDQVIKMDQSKLGNGIGYKTINEVRGEKGLLPVKNGDVIYIPFGLVPLSVAEQSHQDTTGKSAHIKKDNRAIVEKRIRFISEQMSKSKALYLDIMNKQKQHLIKRLQSKKSVQKAEDAPILLRYLFEGWDDWIGVYLSPAEETLKETIIYSGKQALRQVGVDISFDLLNPRVLDWLGKNALAHATSINGTIKDDMAIKVMDAVAQGLGAKDIADVISGFFDDQAEWRALRIARTEVITGYAQGSLEGYRQSGVVKGKRWLTAGDDKVDDECLENEKQGIIGLEAMFINGGGAPPVHPNCRCVLQPEV